MKISTKGQYALEIVVDLALNTDPSHLESLKSIAYRRKLSEKYLERIMKALKQEGFVASVRGAYGGYYLSRKAEVISVKEVLNAVEGELAPVHCLTQDSDCGVPCGLCPTRGTWRDMWDTITDTVGTITIADIIGKVKEFDK